jgi:hypothetical protein
MIILSTGSGEQMGDTIIGERDPCAFDLIRAPFFRPEITMGKNILRSGEH